MCGWQVKLCDPLVTHGPYLSAIVRRLGLMTLWPVIQPWLSSSEIQRVALLPSTG